MDLSNYIDEKASQRARSPVIGVVQTVHSRDGSSDNSDHFVNVKTLTEREEYRKIPVHTTRNGSIYVPMPGDVVEIGFLQGNRQAAYVSGAVYTFEDNAPLGREGHWRHRFGDGSPYLFVEAEPSDHSAGHPDVIRMGKKQDGLSDPTTEVAIDDSGSATQVRIHTDGDIHLSASGNIIIDEGGTPTSVAKQDHTHPESGGGTTGTPNESGTNTEIE